MWGIEGLPIDKGCKRSSDPIAHHKSLEDKEVTVGI
jgi:hypothetical protein